MMMTGPMPAANGDRPRKWGFSHWIPWVFVGLFLVVLGANGTMIAVAISTFNGLETTNAYEKGLAYNDRLAAAAEQERLGWQGRFGAVPMEDEVELTFELADRLGQPITSATVQAELDRPLQAGFERAVRLDEAAPGRYLANVDLPLAGQWNVRVNVEAHGDRYQLTERIQVK